MHLKAGVAITISPTQLGAVTRMLFTFSISPVRPYCREAIISERIMFATRFIETRRKFSVNGEYLVFSLFPLIRGHVFYCACQEGVDVARGVFGMSVYVPGKGLL